MGSRGPHSTLKGGTGETPGGHGSNGSGTTEEWRWETHTPGGVPAELLNLPGDIRRDMTGEVTLVWRQVRGTWVKWVVVMESAVLRRANIHETGLYAWGRHAKGGVIGRYEGTILAKFKEGRGRKEAEAGMGTPGKYVLEREVTSTVREWVDGEHAGPPYLQKANDGRGITKSSGAAWPNTAILEPQRLTLTTQRAIGGDEEWGRCELGGWDEMAKIELLWSYGRAYWEAHGSGETKQRLTEAREARLKRAKEQGTKKAQREGKEAGGRAEAAAEERHKREERQKGRESNRGGEGRQGTGGLKAAVAYERLHYIKQGQRVAVTWIQEMTAPGRGRLMMQAALKRARGDTWVQLHVGSSNTRARRAYEKMGMEYAEASNMCFAPKTEEEEDTLCMEGRVDRVRHKCEEKSRAEEEEGKAGRGGRLVRHENRTSMQGAIWSAVARLVGETHATVNGADRGGDGVDAVADLEGKETEDCRYVTLWEEGGREGEGDGDAPSSQHRRPTGTEPEAQPDAPTFTEREPAAAEPRNQHAEPPCVDTTAEEEDTEDDGAGVFPRRRPRTTTATRTHPPPTPQQQPTTPPPPLQRQNTTVPPPGPEQREEGSRSKQHRGGATCEACAKNASFNRQPGYRQQRLCERTWGEGSTGGGRRPRPLKRRETAIDKQGNRTHEQQQTRGGATAPRAEAVTDGVGAEEENDI